MVKQLEATVRSDQAQIDAARLNVAYCLITSPIDGITGLRLVDVGNLVQASAATPLVVVTQVKPIFVTFAVPNETSTASPKRWRCTRWRSSRSMTMMTSSSRTAPSSWLTTRLSRAPEQ